MGIISETIDARNWCFDFGGFKRVGNLLREMFDHKLIIAGDDPWRSELEKLRDLGLAQVLIMEHVGCEAFAEFIYKAVAPLITQTTDGRAALSFITVREHGANSATYAKSE